MADPGKPVVALDIDGTLGAYHDHFRRFAEQWAGRAMPHIIGMRPETPFFKHLGMSKKTYRECKLAFRQGGLKRSMPVFEGGPQMTRDFRRAGAEVWLCSTRPYLRHDNIDPDTRHWLRRNRFQWDGIIFGTYKYNDLVKNVGVTRVVAVLDDLPEQCAAAQSLRLPVFLHAQPYNWGAPFPRVYNFTGDPWREEVVNEIRRRVKNGTAESVGNWWSARDWTGNNPGA